MEPLSSPSAGAKVSPVSMSFPILDSPPPPSLVDEDDIVGDGSVDLRGGPVSRRTTGGWKACYFIFGQEVAERIAYYGVAANLVTYLTTDLREGLATAITSVNNWNGAVYLFPFVGAFLSDAYLGRYWTIVAFSTVYVLASGMLTAAVSVRSLKPAACTGTPGTPACPKASGAQFAVFYAALYLMAVGNGGMKPCVSALGADQFDEDDARESKQKLSFFNWWYVGIGMGVLVAITAVVYIQDNVSFGWGYGVLAGALALGTLVLLLGTRRYRHKQPVGSPLTQCARVLVAAARKWRVRVPADAALLHERSAQHYAKTPGRRRVLHTDTLRFLDKAATYDPHSVGDADKQAADPWRLCTVTQVEEIKVFVRMLPIWATNLIFITVYTQVSTLFVKQAASLDRRLGPHFTIPPASFGVFAVLPYLVTIVLYDRLLAPALRRWTGHPRGVPIVVKIGAGLFLSVFAMVTAALVEEKRRRFAATHAPVGVGRAAFLPMSAFWLVPQNVVLSVADSLAIVGQMEFFYDQAPDHMKSVGTAFNLSLMGVGNYLATAIINLTNDVSRRHDGQAWIAATLRDSRLDKFYWLLAVLSVVNLVAYSFFAYTYSYRRSESRTDVAVATTPAPAAAAAVGGEDQQGQWIKTVPRDDDVARL